MRPVDRARLVGGHDVPRRLEKQHDRWHREDAEGPERHGTRPVARVPRRHHAERRANQARGQEVDHHRVAVVRAERRQGERSPAGGERHRGACREERHHACTVERTAHQREHQVELRDEDQVPERRCHDLHRPRRLQPSDNRQRPDDVGPLEEIEPSSEQRSLVDLGGERRTGQPRPNRRAGDQHEHGAEAPEHVVRQHRPGRAGAGTRTRRPVRRATARGRSRRAAGRA